MKFYAKAIALGFLAICFCGVVNAQEKIPSPTPPITDDEGVVCGLAVPELIKLNVSVWNSLDKTYVKNLGYEDFEILEGDEFREIDFFIRPDDNTAAANSKNQYVLGLALWDLEQNKWHDLKVRVKASKGTRHLIVKATPSGYYY